MCALCSVFACLFVVAVRLFAEASKIEKIKFMFLKFASGAWLFTVKKDLAAALLALAAVTSANLK